MMTTMPKKIGRATVAVASSTSRGVSALPSPSSNLRRMLSITTIAPSTTMPKSIAPSESRFAGILKWCMQMKAVSSASGIVTATINAARGLPRYSSSTSVTSSMPSSSVLPTVCRVACTSELRSR